jgi:hypothetical protein
MTDVVKIARKCHAELHAEISRLDEFIRMAEKLLKYEQSAMNKVPSADQGMADDLAGTINASATPAPAGANGAGAKA